MPFNSRDMWVYLKAQDLATRALNSFGRSVRSAGNDVRMAQIEAEQAALRARMAQGKLTGMTQNERDAIQRHISTLQAEKSQLAANDAALSNRHSMLEKLGTRLQSVSEISYAAGFAISAVGVGGVLVMKSLLDATIEYDKQVRLTSTQVEGFSGNFKQIGDIGLKVANDIGVGFQQIQPALYDIFSSIDINVPDAQRLLTAFAKAAVAGQTDIQSVSRGTLGILNSFHLKASDINHVLDLQFEFIKKGVGTYDEWAKRIGLVSPSAVRAGQSLEMMVAALGEASRMSGVASRAGTAVARSFDAFSNPKAIAALKTIGVSVVDAAGNFRPFLDVMFDFRQQLDKIPGDAKKAEVIQQIFKGAGGTIEARRFLQNLLLVHGSLEDFRGILNAAKNSAGAFDAAYGVMADSTAVKTERIKNRWKELKITLGEQLIPVFDRLLNVADKILGKLNSLSPEAKKSITDFLAIGTAIALVVGPLALAFGWVSRVGAALIAAGPEIAAAFGFIALVAGVVAAVAGGIYLLYKNSQPFLNFLSSLGDEIKDIWHNYLIPFAKQIRDAFMKDVVPAFEKLWRTINEFVLPAMVSFWDNFYAKHKGSIQEILNDLRMVATEGFKYISWVIKTVLIPAIKWMMDQYQAHKTGIDKVVGALVMFGKWILIIAGSAFIGALIVAVAGILTLMTIFAAVIGGLIWLISKIAEGISWLLKKIHSFGVGVGDAVASALIWVGKFVSGIGTKFSEIVKWFGELPAKIGSALVDLGRLLYDVGRKIIEGLISGFNSMVGHVKGFFSGLTSSIAGWKGPPAKDKKLLYDSGRLVMQGFISGLNSVAPALRSQLGEITNSISPTVNASISTNPTGGRQITQNVYITTQEINPREHAIELGRLLAGSI